MKRKTDVADIDPLDREIDFTNARPNPFARDFYKSRNLRVLAPDLIDAFPDSESVNEALRMIVRVSRAAPQQVSAHRAAAPKTSRPKSTRVVKRRAG
jgi:hypothetical protein